MEMQKTASRKYSQEHKDEISEKQKVSNNENKEREQERHNIGNVMQIIRRKRNKDVKFIVRTMKKSIRTFSD